MFPHNKSFPSNYTKIRNSNKLPPLLKIVYKVK